MERTCANCKFFVKHEDITFVTFCATYIGKPQTLENRITASECHRYPKTYRVSDKHWCGEWKDRVHSDVN